MIFSKSAPHAGAIRNPDCGCLLLGGLERDGHLLRSRSSIAAGSPIEARIP